MLVEQCHFSIEQGHFCHSISFFSIKYRRATAPSFSLQCLLDGSSNLARGYFFLLVLKIVVEHPFDPQMLSTIGCCLLLVAVYYWLLFPGKCFILNA